MILRFAAMAVLGAACMPAQSRFDTAYESLKGFTMSPNEHIMNEHPTVISLRRLRGRITEGGSNSGLPATLIEVRKAVPGSKVLRAKSDLRGFFHLSHLSEGEYLFKVTHSGFQSTYGRLTLSKRAPKGATFEMHLALGV